jgi:hypothetical protein
VSGEFQFCRFTVAPLREDGREGPTVTAGRVPLGSNLGSGASPESLCESMKNVEFLVLLHCCQV